MILIIGLGNPGKKYENTRHNIGFKIVDEFSEKNNFPKFGLSKKFDSLSSEGVLEDKKIILAKPQTFMNESGEAVKRITTHYKLPITNLIVIHDDIDLPLGKIKISVGRGSAGHKGVESIIKHLKTADFIRIRVGILPNKVKPENPEKFVLQSFSKGEKEVLDKTIKSAVGALGLIINKGAEKAMNEYNK